MVTIWMTPSAFTEASIALSNSIKAASTSQKIVALFE